MLVVIVMIFMAFVVVFERLMIDVIDVLVDELDQVAVIFVRVV